MGHPSLAQSVHHFFFFTCLSIFPFSTSATSFDCTVISATISQAYYPLVVSSKIVLISITVVSMSNMELSDQLCPVCQTRFLTKLMYSQGYHTPENVGRMYQKVRTCHHISPFHTNASQCPANTHDEDRLCTGFV